jgi:hypothetical protein
MKVFSARRVADRDNLLGAGNERQGATVVRRTHAPLQTS